MWFVLSEKIPEHSLFLFGFSKVKDPFNFLDFFFLEKGRSYNLNL